MIYVVFGVGFSGTTLVSELIHHSGIKMIDQDNDDYDHGNKYEHLDFQNINKEILSLSNDIVRHLRPTDCPVKLSEPLKKRMVSLIKKQDSKYKNWGFKDPRTAVTYPLWRELLPEHKIIIIFRDPSNNWYRRRWRGYRKRYENIWRAYKHLMQWWEYNDVLLQYGCKQKKNFLLINYEELMSTEIEINRLSHFIEKDIEDKRDQSMYRSRGKPDVLFRLVRFCMNRWSKYKIDLMWSDLLAEKKMQIKREKNRN